MSITIRMLDKMWEFIIKDRAGWRCEMCATGASGLHAAHIIGRGAMWTRWRLRNGLGLCPECHVDAKIKAWLKANFPARWRWVLRQRRTIHRGRGPSLKNEYRRLRAA